MSMNEIDEDIIVYLLDWFHNNAVWVEVTKSDIQMPDEKGRIFFDVARCCVTSLEGIAPFRN